MAECKSCGVAVKWVRTRNGKRMPINPEPVAGGNLAIVGEADDGFGGKCPKVAYVQADAIPGMSEPKYVSHFSTCPDAEHHRRGGGQLQ